MNEAAVLVFARCVGFAFRAPGFAHPSVPAPVRAGLALLLTAAIVPSQHAPSPVHGPAIVVALAAEFLVGNAIGFAASIVYDAAYAGGRAIDDYTGVKAIAPGAQLVAPSGFGRIWSLAFTGGFFLLGAYRITILAFAYGFDRIPIGFTGGTQAWMPFALSLCTTVLAVGAAVSAPAIALTFVVHVAFGALSRAIPRFGSATLAFAPAFGAALIATALALPAVARLAMHPLLALPGTR